MASPRMPDALTARRINRAHWDALAAAHGQDAVYDTEALVAGGDSLHEPEAAGVREAIGAVAGLDVLHLQCHIGFDAISLARRGARVVGVDFSPASLEKARALARRCQVDVEFVEADAAALGYELHNRFDLVYATIGVICWIEDLRAWMRSAAAALRGGGKLLLVDIHPVYEMVESTNPLRLDFPYAHDGPRTFDVPGSYAGADLPVAATDVGLLRPLARGGRERRARRRAEDPAPRRAPRHRLRPARRRARARRRRALQAGGRRRAPPGALHAGRGEAVVEKTERELAGDCVNAVGQILSNYQAALHLFDDAVRGELLPSVAQTVFAPVRDACAGVTPGLDELVEESMRAVDRSAVAATHSRLITRQAGLVAAAAERADRSALAAAAGRLADLERGSHSAGALFQLLLSSGRP